MYGLTDCLSSTWEHMRSKQNESEVGQIQFPFFSFIEHIICKATFYSKPIEIGQLDPKIQAVEGLQEQ